MSAPGTASLPVAQPEDRPLAPGELELDARLEKTWSDPPGLWGWLTTVDHKRIGRRYIATAFLFFMFAGVLALIMRAQLAKPDNTLVSPDRYNQLFSLHGSMMMFLFAVPVMEAVAVYIVPLMLGARALSFPRLNAFSYWVYLFGGLFITLAFCLNIGPETGWFSYVPLASSDFSPGKRTDFWAQMVSFTEVAALAVAVALIGSILKMRPPGMTLARMPLFCWAMLVTSFMIVFSLPSVMLATSSLMADRMVGTHFFNAAEGGDPILWQHEFWFFGHPEVYIIFIPALGMVSSIVSTFSRRSVLFYPAMVMSIVATGFLAFGLWVHHMFATGLPRLGNSFYTASSMMIAVPSGVQIFGWIATIFDGKPVFKTPLLFVLGFFVIFVLGGLTGVMVASVPLDIQVHDTYFVVAHFHYVLIGGAVFPLLGAIVYWFPKFTGRLMNETAGKWSFWLAFIGFNLAFFPMHILGLIGMPRRVYTYPAGLGWEGYNLASTLGAFLLAIAVGVFVVNVLVSWARGEAAGDNPWGSPDLEWATASPPAPYNFAHTVVVGSRTPLWDLHSGELPVMEGLATDKREVLVTSLSEAEPQVRNASPDPTIWPLLAAMATTLLFIWSIFSPWGLVWGSLPLAVTLTGWFWPKRSEPSLNPELAGAPA